MGVNPFVKAAPDPVQLVLFPPQVVGEVLFGEGFVAFISASGAMYFMAVPRLTI